MLENNGYVDDDDFGDLYLDVAVGLKATEENLEPQEDDDFAGKDFSGNFEVNADDYGCENDEFDGMENDEDAQLKLTKPHSQSSVKSTCSLAEEESDSESEDGLNILLNDDDFDGKNFSGNVEVNADDYGCGNDEFDGMENDEVAQLKLTKPYSQSSVSLSSLKSNVPAKAASYSTSARGNWEDKTRGPDFASGSIDTQRWRNFTMPRHRTILDLSIDAMEWKPWRLPGADLTDYFNFDLDEDSWKSYCNHLNNCRGKRSDVNGYPAYNPLIHAKEDEVGSEYKLLAEAAAEIDTQSIRALSSSHPMGKPIEVREGVGERQPSVGAWHPERGTGVIIQIPLQDSEEDLPTSAKETVDGKSSSLQESADIKESGDVGQSEGGDAVCFGSPSEGMLPCLDSVSMVSVNCGSPQGSEADDNHKLDILESYSDGSSEAIRSSSDPEEDASVIKPLTAIRREDDLRTADAELKFYSPNLSSSRSYDSASRNGAYVEIDRLRGHSKKVSPTSSLELHDTVKRVYHSSKDSESLGIRGRSGHSENFTRSRSPIRRSHTFDRSRSSRSRSPIQRNHTFHQSRFSRNRSPFRRDNKFHQERSSRMAGLKSYPDNQEGWYVSGSDEHHELPPHTIGRFSERSRHQGFIYSQKEDFWDGKGPEESFYCGGKRLEDRLSVEEMDALHYDYTGKFIPEQSPIPDHRKRIPRKGKLEEMHLTRRRESSKFKHGCIYKDDYSQENYTWERDVVEHTYDMLLSYPQREADIPTDSPWKFDRVQGNIRNQDWEDQKVRYNGEPLPSSPKKYHYAGMDFFSSSVILEREDAQMQYRCFERYSERDSAAFHNDEDSFDYQDDIGCHDDQVSFIGKRPCLESKELHGREELNSSWDKDSDFQVSETLNPVKGTLRGKRFGFVHDHEGKLIGYDYKQKRCKRLGKGNNDGQFLQNPNFTQKVIAEQTVPGNWNYTDKGNRKSSRCFEGRGFMSNARYDQPGQRISEFSNESHIENTVRAGNNRSKTFKGAKKDDSSDIEEGQIIVHDFDEETKEMPRKNPRILEMIAKMEKRQQRFKQPLINASEKNDCPSVDNVAKTMDSNTKIQRPARKRKWIAS